MALINKFSGGLILLLAAFSAQAAGPAGPGRFFCCEGGSGRICGDSFPIQCRGKAYTILDSSGVLIKEVGPPLTAEQKTQLAAEERRKKEIEEQARDQRRQDQALLNTYATPRDIDLAQEKAEGDVNLAIKATEERIAAARNQRKKFVQEAEFYTNKSPPADVAKGLRDTAHEIKTQQELLNVKKGDFAAIKAKYDADRKRYNELTGRTSASATPSEAGKSATR